jgi:putative PIN family toxin of toxin-antitoxin system
LRHKKRITQSTPKIKWPFRTVGGGEWEKNGRFSVLTEKMVSHTIPDMQRPQIVIATDVFVAALLSQKGASYRLLLLADSGLFTSNLSVPLVVEYEDAASRILKRTKLSREDLRNILDYVCEVGNRQQIYYLWRPFLRNPKDDMVLELAVAAECEFIVTFNQKDFIGVDIFGVGVVTPQQFLHRIGQIK